MNTPQSETLVTVYSTPDSFDAGFVKAMLADSGLPSFLEDSHSPFPGLSVTPCHLMVTVENESLARKLIEEHEQRHADRVEHEIN